jgi:putative chitinase
MIPTVAHLTAAGVSKELADRWIPYVQIAFERFQINTPKQVAGWIAQCAHESGGFKTLTENLNYSADTMAAVWPGRFAVMGPDKKPVKVKGKNQPNKFALALHRQPQAIANTVYANRMANGNIESGDGWKYRGRGLKQLTGKDNYTRCGQALNMDLVGNPDLLLEPAGASLSAAWFWSTNKCGPIADSGDFVVLTKKINGGTIGLEDRQKRYKAVLAVM